jgi:hypothetical protein
MQLALDGHWAVLTGVEYWFARAALRGGRTEIRDIYHVVSDEDWARGVRIRYQDICSQYPYQQVVHDFPVGTPVINVWDHSYYPCMKHINAHKGKCNCESKPVFGERCRIVERTDELDINSDKFFGIVCVTLTAPKKLFHPVLVVMDHERNKCVASLEDKHLVEIVTTSVELQEAVKQGYKIIKVHRYDEYTRKPSLWRDIMLKFYVEKMINSGNVPENIEDLINKYEEKYEIGHLISKAVKEDRFKKNPSLKQTAKIMINSMWGKHAQQAVLDETSVLDYKQHEEELNDLFANIEYGSLSLRSFQPAGEDRVITTTKGTELKNPNFHHGYLPAALFVPAYGRLQLLEQLTKLGNRVLMNDTDSIVYIYDPEQYNIPQGEMLGEWEVENIDKKNGGIRKFVGLGPKTYGVKCENGATQVKAKGLSLKLAHEELVNFEVMEDMVKQYLEYQKCYKVQVPQFGFTWKPLKGMFTMLTLKNFEFKPDEMKGVLDGSKLYPFGYQ